MDGRVVEIYEKYCNLFKIKITGPIETIHQLATAQGLYRPKLPPLPHDQNLPTKKAEAGKEGALRPIEVKDLLRDLFCGKADEMPDLRINDWRTEIVKQKTELGRYGDRVAIVRPGFDFRIVNIGAEYYLCLDYMVVVKNHLNAAEIMALLPTFSFSHEKGFYKDSGEWKQGRIEDMEGGAVAILTEEGPAKVPLSQFVPDIAYGELSKILETKGLKTSFDRDIKKLGLLTVDKAPEQRMRTIVEFAVALKGAVFPIKVGDCEIDIDPNPTRLIAPAFDVRTDIEEPFSAFDHEDETKRSRLILDGLTRHGSYEKPKTEINAVILTTEDKVTAI
jgi:hypothetical protein